MKSIVRRLERGRDYRNDGGFTLVEMLITIVVLGMITASVAAAFSLTIKTSSSANDRIKKTNDAQLITKYLVPDAASAGGYNDRNDPTTEGGSAPGVYVQSPATSGFCNLANSVVRFEWIARTQTTVTRVGANYSLVGNNLTRTYCTQGITPVAGENRTALVIGQNIATAAAECFPGPPSACGPGLVDPQPAIVTLNVETTDSPVTSAPGYKFSASGFVRVGGTSGTPTSATVPLIVLGVPGAPCPATAAGNTFRPSSGVAVAQRKTTSSPGNPADPFEPKITVFGIAAINSNATTAAACGQAGDIYAPTGWFATQTLVVSPGTCTNCGATIPIAEPLADPYAGMTPPTYNCNSGPNQPANQVVGNERRYQPGTYRTQLNLEINNGADQYIFAPGVYVFCNGMRITSGILAQSAPGGVLFYFAGGSLRRITTGGTDDFSDINFQIDGRPEYRDVIFWQPNPTNTNTAANCSLPTVCTGDIEIPIGENDPIAHPLSSRYGGVIYAPQAQVEFYLPTRETLGQYETVEATAAGVVARKVSADRISRIRLGDGPQTTTTLTSTPSEPVVGQPVTLRATVAPVFPATGVPSGVVTFLDDNEQLGTMPLVNGVATLVTSALGGGSRPLKAIYSGDLVFASSVSPTLSTVFARAETHTVLTTGPNPAGAGQPITLTADVTGVGAGPIPTGTVTFYSGTVIVGAGPLNAVGEAEVTVTLPEGTHQVRAVYAEGDANYLPSTSNIVDQVVKQGSTTLVDSNPNPSNAGQSVALRAVVTPNIPGTPVTGSVTFFDGAVQIGTGNVPLDAAGVGILNVTSLTGGVHNNITARYSGDTLLAPSTSPGYSHTVNFLSGSVSLGSSANPSVINQSITLTATVTGTAGLPLTGRITFRNGATIIGGPTVVTQINPTTATATMTIATLALGPNALTATYTLDPNYATATSPTFTQVVQSGTLTALTSNHQPSADWGQTVTFTATVTENPTGAGNPIGNVNFYDNGSLLAQVALPGSGIATFTTSATLLDVGSHPITAEFVPTGGNYTGSTSAPLNQIVNLATTIMTLASSLNPTAPGQQFTITVGITAATPTQPSGTVYFYDDNVFFAQANVVNGAATFTTSFTEVRNHPITAYFPATGNFQASTYFTLNQGVQLVSTSMVVTSNLNPATPGAAVTLRADISAAVPNPTGTVFFYDNNVFIGSGNVGGGFAVLLVNGFTAGTHPITAYFVGTGNFADSTFFTYNQVVGTINTTLTITSNANPSIVGQSVTLTGTVTAMTGTPTGIVYFYRDNTTNIGQGTLVNGVATMNFVFTEARNYPITGQFVGTGGFNDSTYFTLNQRVGYATTIAITPAAAASTTFGQAVTLTATVGDSAAPVPTGQVQFYDNTVAVGAPVAISAANPPTALFSSTTLPVGPHSITAIYLGDSAFLPSTNSNAVSRTVTAVSTASNISGAAGTTAGRPSQNDVVTFTFSQPMLASSLAVGFTGASMPVTAQLTRATGTTAQTFLSINGVNLGSVNLGDAGGTGTHYLNTATTVTATANMVMLSPTVVTITFTANFPASVVTQAGGKNMIWTPSTAATDVNGFAMSGAVFNEGGNDADF